MFSIGLQGVNYWAVLVAGFGTFMLGGVWYTALFGRRWVALHGFTEAQVKEMQARRPPAVFFGGMFACYLVVALVLAAVFASARVESAATGAAFGLLLWLGVAAAIRMRTTSR
ncbi:MAG: DUF1761 domain-containing protein [Planctomycetes bacterium]|nr:DUF1761 domain-containing protein [Planctomycetota bacterium]